jgi:hypothetical protein
MENPQFTTRIGKRQMDLLFTLRQASTTIGGGIKTLEILLGDLFVRLDALLDDAVIGPEENEQFRKASADVRDLYPELARMINDGLETGRSAQRDLGETVYQIALYFEARDTGSSRNRQARIASLLEKLARLSHEEGRAQRAARLLGAAEGLRNSIGGRLISRLRAALGQDVSAPARAEGRAMTLEQAVTYALEEPGSASPSV